MKLKGDDLEVIEDKLKHEEVNGDREHYYLFEIKVCKTGYISPTQVLEWIEEFYINFNEIYGVEINRIGDNFKVKIYCDDDGEEDAMDKAKEHALRSEHE